MTGSAPRPPAAISREAEALLAAAADQPARDMTLPLAEIRAASRAAYEPACTAALAQTGVDVDRREIAGLPCMVIDPPNRRPDRVLIYLFGGGFTLGSAFEDLPISARLAVGTGARVIAPDYPLAPEHPFPAALQACTGLVRAVLADHPAACLCGESAGGNLALGVTHALRAAGGRVPRALALLSPAADMGDIGDSAQADRDPFLRPADAEFFHAAYIPEGTDMTDPGLSPIYGPFDAGFPPVFITSGTRDLLLSVCVRLDRVLRRAGARSELRVWEGMWHVFEFYSDLPEAEESLSEIAAFLSDHLD